MDTQIIAIVAGGIMMLLLVIAWALSRNARTHSAEAEKDQAAENMQQSQKFDTTFTPNSATSVTAPLVKGGNKGKQPFMPTENEAQLSEANKDETFLPQSTNIPQENQDYDGDALTEQQTK